MNAVWLYARFPLSFHDVEEMLAERGIDVSNETVRRWFLKFGRLIACNLRQSRPQPSPRWHLDEMVIKIRGRKHWLWRAVDDEARFWISWCNPGDAPNRPGDCCESC
jgi:putative transposase